MQFYSPLTRGAGGVGRNLALTPALSQREREMVAAEIWPS